MVDYAVSEQINRSPDAIFPYLADPRRWDWMGSFGVDGLEEGPIKAGARFRTTFTERGKVNTMEVEVAELDAGHRVVFRTISASGLRWDGAFSVEQRDGGSLVRSEGTFHLSGMERLLEPLMAGEVRKREAAELTRLKALLEAGGPET